MKKTLYLTLILCWTSSYANFDVKQEMAVLTAQTKINPKVLTLALNAFNVAAKDGLSSKPILTVVDYSLPSTAKRMWIFDLAKKQLLFNTLVAHGKNSGENYAKSFSDKMGTLKSSFGVFVTANTYEGQHGYSLKLKGLEPGINDLAEERLIVMHGAWYVDEAIAKLKGRIGRSWGCFAVNENLAAPIINTVKDGSLIFAYYPDKTWIKHSKYLALNSVI